MAPPALATASLLIAAVAAGGAGYFVDARADRREAAAERAFPPDGQIVEVDGRRVHAVVTGEGPDLVLIHGASGNARDFTFDLAGRLSDRYRVIAFDRPGMGWTDRVSDRFGGAINTLGESPYEQAAFLHAAALQLGAEQPIVLGHSYGGAVALAWALRHDPAALVLLAAASNPWPGGLGALYAVNASALGGAGFVPLITAFAPGAQAEKVMASIFTPQSVPEGYADHVGVGLTLRRETLRANARQVNSLRPHVVEMSALYPSLTLPVEILHGTEDTIVPLAIHSVPLSQQIPGATLTILDGVGHMPHHADPEAVTQAIDRAAARATAR